MHRSGIHFPRRGPSGGRARVGSGLGRLAAGAVVALYGGGVSAQTDTAAARAAHIITVEAIARHVAVLANDSMAGRNMPSRGLTQAADYVAEQFRTLGLQPGMKGWVQTYPVATSIMKLNDGVSRLYCSATSSGKAGGTDTMATAVTFANGAYFAVDTVLESGASYATTGPVVAVSGRQTPATVGQDLRGRVVLYLPAPGVDSATQRQVLRELYAANRVLVLSRDDSATFTHRQQAAATRLVRVIDQAQPFTAPTDVSHWAAYVWPGAIQGCLEHAGVQLDKWRSDTVPTIRELPGVTVWSVPRFDKASQDVVTGMNVIGILPGTGFATKDNDSPRQEQVLVISAHMDHSGISRGRPDRNGANDNASGVAVLLELAKTFGKLDPQQRPHRSIIFLATSGAHFWGSTYWIEANADANLAVAANINLDMLGRRAGDSVWVDGLRDVEWPVPLRPDLLATLYPELHLTVVDGGSIVRPLSDHFAFVGHSIPSLYFYDDDHAAPVFDPGVPSALDPARTARIAEFVFYLIYRLGNETQRPTWTSEGRRNRLSVFDSP